MLLWVSADRRNNIEAEIGIASYAMASDMRY